MVHLLHRLYGVDPLYLPKLIKIHANLTKFGQKQKWLIDLMHSFFETWCIKNELLTDECRWMMVTVSSSTPSSTNYHRWSTQSNCVCWRYGEIDVWLAEWSRVSSTVAEAVGWTHCHRQWNEELCCPSCELLYMTLLCDFTLQCSVAVSNYHCFTV